MKNIIFEFILVAASLALWLVVLPVAAVLSPVLLVLRTGGGPRSRKGRPAPPSRLLPVPA